MPYSRRDFVKIALASVPFSAALGESVSLATIDSKVNGVRLGVQTYSFLDLPADGIIDAVIGAMKEIGLGECEMFAPQIEPGAMEMIRALMSGAGASPSERAKMADEFRKKRMSVPMDHFRNVSKRFDGAGIEIYAYNGLFGESDEEIERTFEIAKALGAKVITWSGTLTQARRVAPFADKHKMVVGMHNHSDVADPDQFATPESFAKAMDMSKYFQVNLDIGHFTAAGYDPVAYIQEHHTHITNLHLKDRKKNQGPNMPWGEGDTPIKEALRLLKAKQYPIPAYIEYEYKGSGSRAEVKKCFEYAKAALA
jgi:sugar phosphate isomerase/epimerase